MGTAIAINSEPLVLDWKTSKAIFFQALLVTTAVLLPSLCHLTGAPVRTLLPMHWPVLLAGLLYGWRGGLIVGAVSPLASFALSGMPPAQLLPFMGFEMAVYGFCAGFARQILRFNAWIAVLSAIAAGRTALLGAQFIFGARHGGSGVWLTALLPGIPAALAQTALLPSIF